MNKNLINTFFKSVGLAMGIATLVLSIIKTPFEPHEAISMLSIAVVCLGIVQFNN